MSKSQHGKWMITIDGKQCIFRKIGEQYDVLEIEKYPYTPIQVDKASTLIRANLTDDLISDDIKQKYPKDNSRWKYPFFGHCVTATFTLLYLMDTNSLEPMRGEDASGEGHWWLKDILTNEVYDLTLDQFPTNGELVQVYATGVPRGYFGLDQMPASQHFDLIQKLRPDLKRWTAERHPAKR